MNHHRLAAMAEATRLTREGRLTDATALIQRWLHGLPAGHRAGPVRADPPAPEREASGVSRMRPGRGGLLGPQSLRDLPGLAPGLRTLPPALPAGPPLRGETLVRSYRGPAGQRPYRLYVPSGCSAEPVPLLVMLHGGTQGAAEFAAATRMDELAEEHTFLVAYPEQVVAANPLRCWNWFRAADQHRGSGEPSLIAGITAQVLAEHPADPHRVCVAGFSAGAAMAAVMAATHPDVYAAAGVHSGLAYGTAHDLTSAFAVMRQGPQRVRRLARAVPVITVHGDADTTVSPVNAAAVIEQFVRDGTATSTATGGHAPGRRSSTCTRVRRGGRTIAEQWTVHGSGHAWSGGVAGGSHTDPQGPDASAEMVRFFAEQGREDGW
jgi:poly(hydroxyalkanoate) depolymerase family esterase